MCEKLVNAMKVPVHTVENILSTVAFDAQLFISVDKLKIPNYSNCYIRELSGKHPEIN